MSATIKSILANAYVIQKMSYLFYQSQIKVVTNHLENKVSRTLYFVHYKAGCNRPFALIRYSS